MYLNHLRGKVYKFKMYKKKSTCSLFHSFKKKKNKGRKGNEKVINVKLGVMPSQFYLKITSWRKRKYLEYIKLYL